MIFVIIVSFVVWGLLGFLYLSNKWWFSLFVVFLIFAIYLFFQGFERPVFWIGFLVFTVGVFFLGVGRFWWNNITSVLYGIKKSKKKDVNSNKPNSGIDKCN